MPSGGKRKYGPADGGDVRGDKQLPPKRRVSGPPSTAGASASTGGDPAVGARWYGVDYVLPLENRLKECLNKTHYLEWKLSECKTDVTKYRDRECPKCPECPEIPECEKCHNVGPGDVAGITAAVAAFGGLGAVIGALAGVGAGGVVGIATDGTVRALEPWQYRRWDPDDHIPADPDLPPEAEEWLNHQPWYKKAWEEFLEKIEEQVKSRLKGCGLEKWPAVERPKFMICVYRELDRMRKWLEDPEECECDCKCDDKEEEDKDGAVRLSYRKEKSCYERKWKLINGTWKRVYVRISCPSDGYETSPWS